MAPPVHLTEIDLHNRWKTMAERVARLYDGIGEQQVTPTVTVEELRTHLRDAYGDFAEAVPPESVLDDVMRMLTAQQVHTTHPRYFGLFNPSVQPASVVADALVAAANPQVCVWSHAPAANEVERHVMRYLSRKLACDPERWFAGFTSGGSEANQTAVIAALTHLVPGFDRDGVAASGQRPVLYLSEESHHSFEKIVHGAGLGRASLRRVPVDRGLRLDVPALAERIAEDRRHELRPLMVVATAGTTGAGVVDPLPELAALCRAEALWLHVDAAWGGAACLSPRLARVLSGIEQADSITWDAHKWLSVPMGAGMFFCRHRGAMARAFAVDPLYMPASTTGVEEPYLSGILWSRRFIGLKVFMALAELGEDGYRRAIEHQAAMGDLLRQRLVAAGWRIVNDTPLPVVCFTGPPLESGRLTAAEAASRVQKQGVWISPVRLTGLGEVLRACVTSFRSTAADVEALVQAVSSLMPPPA